CDADRRRHRLVQVQDVEPLARERLLDAEDRPRTEDDVRQRAVRRHDHRAADGDDLRRRIPVPAVPWVQDARELAGRVVAHQIAALGLAGTILAGAFTIFNFLTYGTTAVVARASGAGQQERAARLAAQALWVSLAIGVGLLIVGEAVAGPVLRGLGAHGRSGHFAFV